jgi:hypothetical protein
MVTGLIGGADASESASLASSETYGQAESSALPAAKAIAKARQVGTPHSLQFVLGNNLKISIPVSAIYSLHSQVFSGLEVNDYTNTSRKITN